MSSLLSQALRIANLALVPISAAGAANLVPATPDPAPDYFCTWNLQGYVCNYASGDAQRRAMCEANLFGFGPYQNWRGLLPKLRGDLIFVMDDSWDVPLNGDSADFGSLILNSERFPSYGGDPAERLKKLTAEVKEAGWKGLGGWVCAQRAPRIKEGSEEDYWTERMRWMRESGFSYWKVDWGKNQGGATWRRMLTDIGHKEAPGLVIEHAITPEAAGFADVYRTYDVENVIAAPVTIDRVANLLRQPTAGSPTLINCEDEPYIAAGLGCVIGMMRHPFVGAMPNGQPDIAFPAAGRDLKRRLDEVVRAVRWHRIAAPLPIGAAPAHIAAEKLSDYWTLAQGETWTPHHAGDRREGSAPARISRGLELPEVSVNDGEALPFVLATRSASGAVAVATIGRTLDRKYITSKARVTLPVADAPGPFGIFGCYDQLTLRFDHPFGDVHVFAQDLAGEQAEEITDKVTIRENELSIPGELLQRIGLSAATRGDLSEPGLVMAIEREKKD